MEEAILAYLEHFGQPQTVEAIQLNLAGGDPDHYDPAPVLGIYEVQRVELEAVLTVMASDGRLKLLSNHGVWAGEAPMIEYAPLSFAG